jgi:hypothetical protein
MTPSYSSELGVLKKLDSNELLRRKCYSRWVQRQLDYRSTYDAYERLNNETRANLSFENFTRLKEEEKKIIKGQERVPLLLDQLFRIEREINANEAAQKKPRILGLVASILGSSLLLFANLVAEKEPK